MVFQIKRKKHKTRHEEEEEEEEESQLFSSSLVAIYAMLRTILVGDCISKADRAGGALLARIIEFNR